MSLSQTDLSIAREANARIKSYERYRPKRLIGYLVLVGWIILSTVDYVGSVSWWALVQLIFWTLAFIGTLLYEHRTKKPYLHDLATLDGLRKLQGVNLTFGNENIVNPLELEVVEEHKRWKGFEPLVAFGLALAVLFLFTHFLRSHH